MRDILDRAYTPFPLAAAIVNRMALAGYLTPGQRVWEPCAGQGAFVAALLRVDLDEYPPLEVFASDIDEGATLKLDGLDPTLLDDVCGWRVGHDALLGWPAQFGSEQPDWVISNPPFARHTGRHSACKCCGLNKNCEKCDGGGQVPIMETIWHEHVKMALGVARVGVAMLLRNSWIEPVEGRRELVDMVSEMWPVTPRPSYSTPTGPSRGTDSVGSTVFLWRKDGFVPKKPVTSLAWTK